MSYDSFFEYFFQTRKGLCVFPTAAIRQYWTKRLAITHSCISLESLITPNQLRHRLFLKSLDTKQQAERILSATECDIFIEQLLQDPKVIDCILEIEQLKKAQIEQTYIQKIPARYKNKVLQLFQHYLFYANTDSRVCPYLDSIIAEYKALLSHYHCADENLFDYELWQQKREAEEQSKKEAEHKRTEHPPHVYFLYPELYPPQVRLWIQNFGKEHTSFAKSHADILPRSEFFIQNQSHVLDELVDTHCSFQCSYEFVSPEESGEKPIDAKKPSYKNTLSVYSDIRTELEDVFVRISMLLREGERPSNIVLAICQSNELMITEIELLAQKYAIPITFQSQEGLAQFVSGIQELYASNFSPDTMKRLFFNPRIPWKSRELLIELVSCGLEHASINDESLTLWMATLSSEVRKCFQQLVTRIKKIVHASSFLSLYEAVAEFIAEYFTAKPRALGTYDTEALDLGNQLLKEIEQYITFEQFITSRTQEQQEAASTLQFKAIHLNAWQEVIASLDGAQYKSSSKFESVQILRFKDCLGTHYPHQFVCNFTLRALMQECSFHSVFNDYLSKLYDSEEIHQNYKRYQEDIIRSIDTHPSLRVSVSHNGFEGANIIPVYWEQDAQSHITQDIWEEELQAGDKVLYIHPSQKEGLEYMLGLDLDTKKHSIREGIDKVVFKYSLDSNPNKLISATNFSQIFQPAVFYFEEILQAHALLPQGDRSLHEHMVWGSVYHALMEEKVRQRYGLDTKKSRKESSDDTHEAYKTTEEILERKVPRYLMDAVKDIALDFPFDAHLDYLHKHFFSTIDNPKENIRVENPLELSLGTFYALLYKHYSNRDSEVDSELVEILSLCNTSQLLEEFTHYTIKGRADIVAKEKHGSGYILDFKKRLPDIKYQLSPLLQIWIYHCILNMEQIAQTQSLSLLKEDDSSFAYLYYLMEKIEEGVMCVPPLEFDDKDRSRECINYIPQDSLSAICLLNLLQLGLNKLEHTQASLEDFTNRTASLRSDMSRQLKHILREGARVYVK